MASRSFGGVSMTERSRIPPSARFSERGIGVADIERTSTEARSSFSFSFCATPKRCSSSTTTRPRSLKETSFERIRCVPTTTSSVPSARRRIASFCSSVDRKRERRSIVTGKAANRRRKVRWCWSARMVVGARIAACLPSRTHLKTARIATSVLPYPTSPQRRRSIAFSDSMSRLMSRIAPSWSGVSVNSKASSNSFCHGESFENACPGVVARRA